MTGMPGPELEESNKVIDGMIVGSVMDAGKCMRMDRRAFVPLHFLNNLNGQLRMVAAERKRD